MQATLPPVWSEIERYRRQRGRVTLAELSEITARAHQMHMQELRRLRELHARLDWPRTHRPEILPYVPNPLRNLLRRLDSMAEEAQPSGGSWRPGPLGAPWHLPDGDISQPSQAHAGAGGAGGAVGAGGAERAGEWWSWRGWGAGALLLVAALLLVRATDRCFTRNYVRYRLPLSVDAETSPTEFDALPSESETSNDIFLTADLPPPYSECADSNKHVAGEEPPPPYSACYVAFSNPKDGPPSVTFLNSQRQNMFEDRPTSTRFINVQTSTDDSSEIAHSSNGFNIDTGQIPSNPIGDRIYKLPYFDNTNVETDDSDDCNGECITASVECINVGPAPIACQDMTIDIPNVGSDAENNETAASC
ncbi:unnamed protein product [Euphydryas editha]|uniref:Uncharacterized protein n=1 Tax=Euphydryas editha TaxID=104508 RepID=A0AAU9UHE2_EUPED|nr:unnamed protein product [Euphydryas editha]